MQMFKRCYLMTDKAERLSMKDLLNVVVVVFVWWYVRWCLCGGMYGGGCVIHIVYFVILCIIRLSLQ